MNIGARELPCENHSKQIINATSFNVLALLRVPEVIIRVTTRRYVSFRTLIFRMLRLGFLYEVQDSSIEVPS